MSRLMIVEVPSYSCEFKGIREVRELVRCGECIYAEADTKANMYRCRNVSFPMWNKPDGFCSYGERKENE